MEAIINYIALGVVSGATLYIFFLLGHQVGFDKGIKQYAYNWREGGKFSLEENN